MQVNGWKISPVTAATIAINLVGWGITLGTILTKLDSHNQRIVRIEDTVFPTARADERNP